MRSREKRRRGDDHEVVRSDSVQIMKYWLVGVVVAWWSRADRERRGNRRASKEGGGQTENALGVI